MTEAAGTAELLKEIGLFLTIYISIPLVVLIFVLDRLDRTARKTKGR